MENNFASNLKHLRVQSGMTQLELAKKLDKDYSTIGKWELGQRSPMMIDVIRIAELFNVSLEYLIGSSVDNSTSDEIDLQQYKVLFDKDNKLTDVQKEFILNTIEEQHRKIDEGIEKGNVN
jgi:transcriptional regulator with XRE-family HTH domain